MRHVVLFLCVISLTCSCTLNKRSINDESDRDDGLAVVNMFYGYLINEKIDSVPNLFADDFYLTTSQEELISFLENNGDVLGKVSNAKLKSWKTIANSGKENFTQYFYTFEVDHENYTAEEIFRLAKEDSIVKIVSYNITSDAFN